MTLLSSASNTTRWGAEEPQLPKEKTNKVSRNVGGEIHQGFRSWTARGGRFYCCLSAVTNIMRKLILIYLIACMQVLELSSEAWKLLFGKNYISTYLAWLEKGALLQFSSGKKKKVTVRIISSKFTWN